HPVELLEVIESAFLHVESLLFDDIASAEGIDGLSYSCLESDNLLSAQRDARSFLGGQGERFVIGVGVQRLRAAEDRRQRLQGNARDVVQRLLRGQRDAGGLGM